MERKMFRKSNRIMAWLLVVCMLLSDCPLSYVKVNAAETDGEYILNLKVTLGTGEDAQIYTIPSDYIVSVTTSDDSKTKIEKSGDSYKLASKTEYICTIAGEEIDSHEVTFMTPEEAGDVVVQVDKTKIKSTGTALTVNKNDSVSYTTELGITWTVSVNDKYKTYVEITNDGKIKGLEKGTAYITATAANDSTITRTIQVDVTAQGTYELAFQVNGEKQSDIDNNSVTIINETENKTIFPVDGKYTLQWDVKYKYKFVRKGFKTKEGTLSVPMTDKETIEIDVELVEPKFVLEEKDIFSNSTEIKSNETEIVVSCDNYDELYNQEKWYIKVYDAASAPDVQGTQLNEKNNVISTVGQEPTVQLLYDGKVVNTYRLNTFQNYNITYFLKGQSLTTEPDVTFTNNGNSIKVADFNAGNIYKITSVSATGIKSYECIESDQVVTKFTEQQISVSLAGKVFLVEPEITIDGLSYNSEEEVYEGLYGTTSKISVSNKESLLNGGTTGWVWSCKNRESDEMTISNANMLTLDGSTTLDYTLKYYFGTEDTVTGLSVRVNKIKVQFAKNASLGNISKYYNGNGEYKITSYDLSNDIFTDANNNGLNYKKEITLTLIAVNSEGKEVSDVGTYSYVKIIDAEVSNEGDICGDVFNIDALKDKVIPCNMLIQKLNLGVFVQSQTISIQYKSGKLQRTQTKANLQLSCLNDISSEEKSSCLNDITLEEKEKMKDEFINQLEQCYYKTDKTNSRYYFTKNIYENDNIQYTLTNAVEEKLEDDKTSIYYLSYEIAPQEIDYSEHMENKISISQNQLGSRKVLTGTKKWINTSELYFELIDSDYSESYSKFGFKKTKCNSDGKVVIDVQEANIVEGTKNVSWRFDLNTEDEITEDQYYQVILSDTDCNYKAVALIIRIVAEKNKDLAYPDTIVGDNGITYSIVNLYLDASGDEVVFESALGGSKEADISNLKLDMVYKEKGETFTFEITNSASAISEVSYGFAKIEGDSITNDNIIKDGEWKVLSSDAKQSVSLDVEDGDYIMCVKVTDSVGNSSIYVSNGFVVDNTPPELKFYMGDSEIAEDELSQRIYENQAKDIKIEAVEDNIKNVTAEVIAVDSKGNEVDVKLIEDVTEGSVDVKLSKDVIESQIKEEKQFKFKANTNANYTITVTVEDMLGKEVTKTYMFTIDQTPPEKGKVEIAGFINEIKSKDNGIVELVESKFVKSWNSIVEKIYEIFFKEQATVTLFAEDNTTNVKIYYCLTDEEYTETQLRDDKSIDWTEYDPDSESKIKTTVNQRQFVYMKAEDEAGNVSFFNSKGIITDTKAPIVTPQEIKPDVNENGFYSDEVKIPVKVEELTGSTQLDASGLQYVGYRIESNGKVTESKVIINSSTDEIEKSFNIKVNATKHNNNDVRVYITAVDNAGNVNVNVNEPIKLKIDNVAPTIDISFNDQEGADYYNQTRTATITIKERNLDVNDVDITIKSEHGSKATISKWTHSSNAGESDDATHTCRVTFDADDDYEFYVDCKDKAGNKATTSEKHKFTIDKTVPTMDVSYSNGQITENDYYNKAITATITIKEHNFDASKADIKIGGQDGASIAASSFRDNGDTHTANVVFDRDGEYSLEVSYADEAGNEANSYKGNTFNIDLKNPEIVINNVKDKSANKDDVNPVITCTDKNYDGNKVSIKVRGANSGEISLDKLSLERKTIANGEEFSLIFPKDEVMDDIYTLTAEMVDKAGNETEDSIQFSVNRYGSVYTLGTETGEWLTNGVCSYIKEGKPIVIIETNVDEVVEHNISYTSGAISSETVAVKELADCSGEERTNGTYFETKEISYGNDWYQYQHTVAAKNFTKEGNYSIQIDSKDKAGNHTSNVSNKHSDSNLEILFAVDQTAPSAVISGTENGGKYREAKRTVLIDVQDNLALDTVTVYLNDKEYATYDAKEIAELEDGFIPVEVTDSFATQTIQLKATDMAGNILSEDAKGEYDAVFEDFNLIVTRNLLVQILHTYWIFILIGIAAVAGIIVFIVMKRKKKE